jgi:rhodanese-related sulfurtransferase/rubrerythrin
MRTLTIGLLVVVGTCATRAPSQVPGDIPEGKRTTLGLYVTAKQAHAMWAARPDRVKIIDTRTPEEYVFVGHPPMAINIPGWLVDYHWDATGKRLTMRANPRFVDLVRARTTQEDTIIVMCRSGKRSAKSVDALAKAGFNKVYTMVDGFEGDVQKDLKSPAFGKRTVNGWKNGELPWTYDLDPDSMELPKAPCTLLGSQALKPLKISEQTLAALREALDNEYKARATYRKVIGTFGRVRPFVNIVEAEERHASELLAVFDACGVKPPPDRWEKVEAPASIAAACTTAIEAEKANVAMYDRLLEEVKEPVVRDTFIRLRNASRDRHLPAFRRCLESGGRGGGRGSGWRGGRGQRGM